MTHREPTAADRELAERVGKTLFSFYGEFYTAADQSSQTWLLAPLSEVCGVVGLIVKEAIELEQSDHSIADVTPRVMYLLPFVDKHIYEDHHEYIPMLTTLLQEDRFQAHVDRLYVAQAEVNDAVTEIFERELHQLLDEQEAEDG